MVAFNSLSTCSHVWKDASCQKILPCASVTFLEGRFLPEDSTLHVHYSSGGTLLARRFYPARPLLFWRDTSCQKIMPCPSITLTLLQVACDLEQSQYLKSSLEGRFLPATCPAHLLLSLCCRWPVTWSHLSICKYLWKDVLPQDSALPSSSHSPCCRWPVIWSSLST